MVVVLLWELLELHVGSRKSWGDYVAIKTKLKRESVERIEVAAQKVRTQLLARRPVASEP